MATLLHLPVEISTAIIQTLPTKELLCFRQACKKTCARAADLFAKEYFRVRNVMCERRSLESLVGISKHPDLGPYVETLQISVDHLLPLDELHVYGDRKTEIQRFNHSSYLDVEVYRRYLEGQEQMMRTGYDVKCLSQAMEHLTNCKKIIISDDHMPWGLKRLRRDIGIFPQRSLTYQSPRSIDLVRHIIHTTLAAAAASDIPAEDLEMSVGSFMSNANRISPEMLNGGSLSSLAQTPLAHIRHLNLTLDPEVPEYASDSMGSEYSIAQFIRLLPALSSLRLEFEEHDYYQRFSELSEALYIPTLEDLTLSMLDCTCKDMALFLLRHHKTLKQINFEYVLIDGAMGWPWLVSVIRDSLDITYLSMMECMNDVGDIVRSDSLEKALLEAATVQDLTCIINLLSSYSCELPPDNRSNSADS